MLEDLELENDLRVEARWAGEASRKSRGLALAHLLAKVATGRPEPSLSMRIHASTVRAAKNPMEVLSAAQTTTGFGRISIRDDSPIRRSYRS